ncbi:MAG: N-formylglutamate amidohydrolase [Rhodobacteraceae bacterium]|jgi:predicted N-formylglutamate amidohydrolase|nr:N-formylglutamate amidohydrolase [Paracoccaceae bacterium]
MTGLLAADEPDPVAVDRPDATSPFLLIGDHAGNLVPRALGDLGLQRPDLERHIGIDIGIRGLGAALSEALDATFIHQRYSRLVIDCNRPPDQPDAFAEVSDGTRVPGNAHLSDADRQARIGAIFAPYHARIGATLDARIARGAPPPILIALHSFTRHHGDYPGPRPWHIGVLWNRDGRLARRLIDTLSAEGDLVVGINEPYGVSDELDYAVPVHAEARGLLHVEVEVRQDLIADEAGQRAWAARLARLLPVAADGFLKENAQ